MVMIRAMMILWRYRRTEETVKHTEKRSSNHKTTQNGGEGGGGLNGAFNRVTVAESPPVSLRNCCGRQTGHRQEAEDKTMSETRWNCAPSQYEERPEIVSLGSQSNASSMATVDALSPGLANRTRRRLRN